MLLDRLNKKYYILGFVNSFIVLSMVLIYIIIVYIRKFWVFLVFIFYSLVKECNLNVGWNCFYEFKDFVYF